MMSAHVRAWSLRCICFGLSYCVQMSPQISSSQREPNVFHKAAAGAAPFTVFYNVLVGVMMGGKLNGHNYGRRCQISDIISVAPLQSQYKQTI